MTDIAFLFCSDYFDKTLADADYAEEYSFVRSQGKNACLFHLENFLEGGQLKIEPAAGPTAMIYRGWMLSLSQYTMLYNALLEKGFRLINSPEQYMQCHSLPSWYDLLKESTAKSAWSKGVPESTEIETLLKPFGDKPLIVKDYVKSRKHEWEEACFIPDASDTAHAAKVIETFISRQGENLAGGIVLREYLSLNMTGKHEKSGMPIANELRLFCFRHQPFVCIQYWSGHEAAIEKEYLPLIEKCRPLDSNFYTVDIAETADHDWVIMEIGDGQVSGLQELRPDLFYDKLFSLL